MAIMVTAKKQIKKNGLTIAICNTKTEANNLGRSIAKATNEELIIQSSKNTQKTQKRTNMYKNFLWKWSISSERIIVIILKVW